MEGFSRLKEVRKETMMPAISRNLSKVFRLSGTQQLGDSLSLTWVIKNFFCKCYMFQNFLWCDQIAFVCLQKGGIVARPNPSQRPFWVKFACSFYTCVGFLHVPLSSYRPKTCALSQQLDGCLQKDHHG